MMIGNAEYQCSCVRYVKEDNTALIIGLCVGLGLLLIIIVIIVAVLLYRRHRNKLAKQDQEEEIPTEQGNEDEQYNRRLPGDYVKDSEL